MIVVGNYIKWKNKFSFLRYWATHLFNEADLALKFDSRSGNTLINSKSAETATIMVEEYLGDNVVYINGDKTRTAEHLFDGNDHTIYCRMKCMSAVPVGSVKGILWLGGNGTAGNRGIYIKSNYNNFRIGFADGTTLVEETALDINANILPLDYIDIIITIDGTAKTETLGIARPDDTLIGGGYATKSLAAFVFNNNNNAGNFTFGSQYFTITNFKKFSGQKTLVQCKDNSYHTNIIIHWPTVIGLMDISGNNNYLWNTPSAITATHTRYISFNSYALDYGWDEYQESLIETKTKHNIYSCYKPDGTQMIVDVTTPAAPHGGHRLIGERLGGTLYNLFPAKIRFTNAFFDRSNATIWGASARLGYYDAANTKDFHVSELNQRTIQSWLNDGYRGRLYMHFSTNSIERLDRQYCSGIYLYNTDIKGIDQAKVHQYTGDHIAWVGNKTVDAEGYTKLGTLKATKPMLVWRNDDGLDDVYNDWRGFFNGNNIKPVIAIIGDLVGTAGFVTWAQIQTLKNEGWLIGDHGKENISLEDAGYQNGLEARLIASRAYMLANGFAVTHFIGAQHSSFNAALEYLLHKIGYATHLAWTIYGEQGIRGTNPVAINKWRLCALDLDLGGSYDIDSVNPVAQLAAINAQLDLCVSGNRLAITFTHSYTANLGTNCQTVINSAIAKGINIVSLDEAMADLKYL